MVRPFHLLILLLFLCFRLLAQPVSNTTTLLSVNEGLSQGMVFDILQSRDGFLWIATKDGLNRYDGYRFKTYSPNAFDPFSIAASEIRSIWEDKRGWLWIGYENGLDIFIPETGRFFHLPLPNAIGFNDLTGFFAETPDGALWVSGNGKLWRIEDMEATLRKAVKDNQPFPAFNFTQIEAPADWVSSLPFQFFSVIFSKDQTLLATTSNGLYSIETIGGKPRLRHEALSGENLFLIGEDKKGSLWFKTDKQLWVGKNKELALVKIPNDIESKWRFDADGNLWSLSGNVLQYWQPAVLAAGKPAGHQFRISLSSTSSEGFYLTRFTIDHSGNAWVGTSGYGLLKLLTSKPKFESYQPGISQSMLFEDPDGNLFTLKNPNTIFSGNRSDTGRSNPWLSRFPNEKGFASVLFDNKGNGWVNCSDGSLCRIDANTKEPSFFQWNSIGLALGQNGKIWGLSPEALLEFDPLTQRIIAHPFEKNLTLKHTDLFYRHNLMEDSEGSVWIFAFEGLLKAIPAGQGFRFEQIRNNPDDRSSISSNRILSVAEDPLEPHRYLWVGTKGGGLNRLDKQTGKFQHFTTEDGLPDNVIYGILPSLPPALPTSGRDKLSYLWLSTNKGLCRMTLDGSSAFRFKNFTVADGLQSNEFNTSSYLKMKDGTLVVGGINGLTAFHPDSLRFNEYAPQTQIVAIKINNELLDIGTLGYWDIERRAANSSISQYPNIQLSHRQNFLAIEFAALDFTNPVQNQYRYSLVRETFFGKKDDESWTELGEKNSVQFANIRPGRHTFRVLGSNNDGIWSEQPAEFRFTIRPPWWATWWAYLVYALSIGTGIWLYYQYRLRQRLEQQETLRLRELDDFKNRFFTNITHEFRTPLTVILGNLEIEKLEIEKLEKLEIEKLGSPVSAAISQFLNFLISKNALTRRNAESLLRLINQLLDLAKLESNTLKLNYVQGDVLPYLRYITESLHSLANAQNVMLRVESKEPEIVMDYDPERLLQIIHNLLSNAIKFTPSGGRVILDIGILGYSDIGRQSGNIPISKYPNIKISVSDTGIGIPPEDLPHIFDRFYQANNLEKAKAGGTGIGLALTKELVKAMGGDISVESEVGKGTIFTVSLPITQNAPASDRVTSSHPVTAAEPKLGDTFKLPPNLTSVETELPSILLIEDNPDVVEYLAACLGGGEQGGSPYLLDFAYNGRAGIEKALETIPDLIISDVMMPEKNGFEVCETLKNDERTSHIPIVLLTAKADMESRIAGLKRGADAYLAKPFHREELLVMLSNLLELRRKLQARYSKLEIGNRRFTPVNLGNSNDELLISQYPNIPISNSPDPEDAFLSKLKTAIESRLSDSALSVEDICRMVGMSHPVVHRKVTALTGRSLTLFVRSIRLAKAQELLLQQPGMSISEVAYATGFNDPKFFSRVFSEEFGMSPTVFRQNS